jgi:DNA-directed RNA polymerase sigma subunit (sigma70/sigma32)
MSPHHDDTLLDFLAAQVRAHPELSAQRADELIAAAHDGDSAARDALVQHSLGPVLDEAVAHADRGLEVVDLYQEGSVAATVAIDALVERRGSGAHLSRYIRKVVAAHLDSVVEREEALAAEEALIVRDAQLLEAAEVTLRRRLGRRPTDIEVAAVLDWPPERVELVSRMLATARETFDEEIAEYLDDADEA